MITIQNKSNTNVDIYASVSVLGVDTAIRASNAAAWYAAAISQNLMYYSDNVIHTAEGAVIDEIGSITLVPAVLDDNGDIITPAVIDDRYHVNLRITEPLLSKPDADGYPLWQLTAITWMNYGSNAVSNKSEVAKLLSGVEMIDPDTINSPSRTWL